ncbi:MAG TPA: hypothetical protein VFI40_13810 [Nocardioides sp.]|nr:hypothetical protein [Nocardioides sp.]
MNGRVEKVPVEALARFHAAEGRLYPMALADPAAFELAISLVGLVTEELRVSGVGISSVLERRSELIGLVPQLAERAGLVGDALPADAVVDAASAVRCRELGGTGRGETELPTTLDIVGMSGLY